MAEGTIIAISVNDETLPLPFGKALKPETSNTIIRSKGVSNNKYMRYPVSKNVATRRINAASH
jgi:hypothetical protein